MDNVVAYHNSAQTCPVCKGAGNLTEVDPNFGKLTSAQRTKTRPCHGCGGKGWVIVPQSKTVAFESSGAN